MCDSIPPRGALGVHIAYFSTPGFSLVVDYRGGFFTSLKMTPGFSASLQHTPRVFTDPRGFHLHLQNGPHGFSFTPFSLFSPIG